MGVQLLRMEMMHRVAGGVCSMTGMTRSHQSMRLWDKGARPLCRLQLGSSLTERVLLPQSVYSPLLGSADTVSVSWGQKWPQFRTTDVGDS